MLGKRTALDIKKTSDLMLLIFKEKPFPLLEHIKFLIKAVVNFSTSAIVDFFHEKKSAIPNGRVIFQ